MLGLAAVAALAAMAFIGSGTASADSLCLVDPEVGGHNGECPEAKIWKGPVIGLSLGKAVLLAEGLKTECDSETLADWISNEGAHVGLLLLVLHLTFTNCTGQCKTAKAENLPYLALANALKLHVVFTKDPGSTGPPAALLECSLFGFPTNCLYEQPEALLEYELKLEGGALKAEVPLLRGGDSGLCPAKGTWHALYDIYEDLGLGPPPKEGARLWLTALP
jgi:hypothetical protein